MSGNKCVRPGRVSCRNTIFSRKANGNRDARRGGVTQNRWALLLKSGLLSLAIGIAPVLATGAAQAASFSDAPRIKPPAPGPTYISLADKKRLIAVKEALKSRDFATGKALADLVEDPIARELGRWMYFMAQDPNVDFNAADRFLDANPDWPALTRIHAYVEKHIPNDASAHDVLAFFDTREPVTGKGKIQLVRALFAVGDKTGGEHFLRNAWINDTFTVSEERQILSTYKSRLSKEDHAARVDRLLWDRQVTNARRIFRELDSKERRKAEARAALLMAASSAPKMYNALPEEAQLDSGVLHAAVRHFRRRGDEQYAIALAAKAPTDPSVVRNGGRWWDERQLLMRWALKNGRFSDAYSLAAAHGLEDGGDFAEAEFYAGWIALRFLDAPDRAESHFLALASAVGSPISVSRAYYWLGRAAKAQGNDIRAHNYFVEAAKHYYSYYGQLAAEEVGGALSNAKFSPPTETTHTDRALFASRPTVAALRILTDLDFEYEFMVFSYHVDDQLERPGEYLEFAKLTDGEGAPHLTVRAGKVGIQRGAFAPEVAYPLVFVPDEAKRYVAPEIILGLSRQESEFNPRAYSRAGARGVMQIIPSTAQITARKEGLTYSRSALLDDPVYNMTIGSAHLSHLIDRFDGSLIMTLAGYNAGAARVDRWVQEYGDPRSPDVDPLDWVELIPFSETRNYVQRVLENVQVYRGRIGDRAIPGRLYADLERGGPEGRSASTEGPSYVLANLAAVRGKQTLPPLPARTADRAKRFAEEAEAALNPPIEVEAPAAPAPQKQRRGRKASPISFPENETIPALDKEPAPISAPAKIEQIPANVPPSTAPAIITATITEEESAATLTQPQVAQPELAEPLPNAAPAPVIIEASTTTELTTSDDMDNCLTYRAFIASNAEDDAEATDLNAGMLAELRGGNKTC
ncbi:transglycosylase SLT domain-containing protein [Hyphococcus sp. DH-69]|uniref:transglycosylase SLT domain-containing protein n=1 Tax=Hyphococcus formosus TaxID=3143534 RepID=UPI00398AAD1A